MLEDEPHSLFCLKDLKVKEEYRALLPEHSEEEKHGYKDNIQQKGIYLPIIVNLKNVILDGHLRFNIARELGMKKVPITRMEFENDLAEKEFIVDTNLHRRHLNQAQKAELGLKWLEIEKGKAKKRQELTRFVGKGVQKKGVMVGPELEPPKEEKGKALEIVARKVDLRKSTLHKAQKIQKIALDDSEIADEWRKALEGRTTIHRVYRRVKQKEAQRELIKTAQINPESVRKIIENLILGDFRKVADRLVEKSIDLIFTDPPYYKENLGLYEDVAILGKKVLREGGSLICYATPRYLPEIIRMMEKHLTYWWMISIKYNGPSSRDRDRSVFSQWKALLWFVQGKRRDKRCFNDFILSERPEKIYHEWQQSEGEAEYCINNLTQPGELVLDPMVGTGTTGVAALKLGRKFIGIDIDKKMYQIALSRIARCLEEECQKEQDGEKAGEINDEEHSIVIPDVSVIFLEPAPESDLIEMVA